MTTFDCDTGKLWDTYIYLIDVLNFFLMIMVVLCALMPLLPSLWENPMAHFGKCMPALGFIALSEVMGLGDTVLSFPCRREITPHVGCMISLVFVSVLLFMGLFGFWSDWKN